MNIFIRKASTSDVEAIQQVADKSWNSAYQHFLSKAQIDLMLTDLYATSRLEDEIISGVDYRLVEIDGKLLGFICSKPKKESLTIYRIEKLYILPEAHKMGLGKMLINEVSKIAKKSGYTTIELNVNRENPALHFYKKVGFSILKEIDIPYHQFILNDYVMQKLL